MSQSTTTTFRALLMLSCAVGITLAAMSGTSWTEILDKFRDLDWPIALRPASASVPAAKTASDGSDSICTSDAKPRPPLAADVGVAVEFPPPPHSPLKSEEIQRRLRELGATYYLLETWGSERKLYRFSCKMAVSGAAEITRYFEAVDADPLQAMLQVLGQVEPWRERDNDHILTLKKIKQDR